MAFLHPSMDFRVQKVSCKYGTSGYRLHFISETMHIYPINLYIFRNCVEIPRK